MNITTNNGPADQDARRVASELAANYAAHGTSSRVRPSLLRRLGTWLHAS